MSIVGSRIRSRVVGVERIVLLERKPSRGRDAGSRIRVRCAGAYLTGASEGGELQGVASICLEVGRIERRHWKRPSTMGRVSRDKNSRQPVRRGREGRELGRIVQRMSGLRRCWSIQRSTSLCGGGRGGQVQETARTAQSGNRKQVLKDSVRDEATTVVLSVDRGEEGLSNLRREKVWIWRTWKGEVALSVHRTKACFNDDVFHACAWSKNLKLVVSAAQAQRQATGAFPSRALSR